MCSLPALALNGLSGYVCIDKAALFTPEYLDYYLQQLFGDSDHADNRDTSHSSHILHRLMIKKALFLAYASRLHSGR